MRGGGTKCIAHGAQIMSSPIPHADAARALTKQEWIVSLRQLLSLRAFWKRTRSTVFGEAWIADYGPLPCDRPHGHDGPRGGARGEAPPPSRGAPVTPVLSSAPSIVEPAA